MIQRYHLLTYLIDDANPWRVILSCILILLPDSILYTDLTNLQIFSPPTNHPCYVHQPCLGPSLKEGGVGPPQAPAHHLDLLVKAKGLVLGDRLLLNARSFTVASALFTSTIDTPLAQVVVVMGPSHNNS